MGHAPNKYHVSDDGKVFRINDDGSFTAVGDIADIYEAKHLREQVSRLNRQLRRNNAQAQASCEQIENKPGKKPIGKIVITCLFLIAFLIMCFMAIINS